jgi:hypothetical protein
MTRGGGQKLLILRQYSLWTAPNTDAKMGQYFQ